MDTRLEQAARLIESERSQIGHEIHDAVLPLIFAASASLARVIDHPVGLLPEQTELLKQTAAWLDDAMQSGRRLLSNVYPPELVGTLWRRAAADTIDRLYPESSVQIDWQLAPEVDEVSEPVALAAYRIVVEAVRNSHEHSAATKIVVEGQTQGDDHDKLHITVRDNGRGFDPNNISNGHFGVRSMIGRAKLVGGDLSIESQPGGPTTVTFMR